MEKKSKPYHPTIQEIQEKQRMEYQKIKISINITPTQYQKSTIPYLLGNNRAHFKKIDNIWVDGRVNYLDSQYFTNKNVLDVGCGEGILTLIIALKYFPSSIHGIDINIININKAKSHLQRFIIKNEHYQNIINNSDSITNIKQLPIYFQQKFTKNCSMYIMPSTINFIPYHPSLNVQNYFPKNVAFINQNFFLMKGTQIYDTILCLKVSKWIHLCYGDEGIISLFFKLVSLLKKGGFLILESQNWGSYKKKKNSNLIHKRVFRQISDKPQKFPSIMIQFGLVEVKCINQLKYPIRIFQKSY